MLFACSIIIRIYIVGSFSYSYVHATDLITPSKICLFLEKKRIVLKSTPSHHHWIIFQHSVFIQIAVSPAACLCFPELYCTVLQVLISKTDPRHNTIYISLAVSFFPNLPFSFVPYRNCYMAKEAFAN